MFLIQKLRRSARASAKKSAEQATVDPKNRKDAAASSHAKPGNIVSSTSSSSTETTTPATTSPAQAAWTAKTADLGTVAVTAKTAAWTAPTADPELIKAVSARSNSEMENSGLWDSIDDFLKIDQPRPLIDYGMSFDNNGKVIHTSNRKNVFDCDDEDGFRLALGYAVMKEMEAMDLVRVPIRGALDTRDSSYFGYFLASPEFEKKAGVIVLLHHSGHCYAGMWSQKLVIKEGLATGSMASYVKEAKRTGMGIVLANPKMIAVTVAGKPIPLLNSRTAIEHFQLVMNTFLVFNENVKAITIVAHSDACILLDRYLANNAHSGCLKKLKNLCLIGGVTKTPENAPFFPTITTWSTRGLSKKGRNIFINDDDAINRWPSRCVHSIFAVVRGGSMDEAQLLIDSDKPFEPKPVDMKKPMYEDPFAGFD